MKYLCAVYITSIQSPSSLIGAETSRPIRKNPYGIILIKTTSNAQEEDVFLPSGSGISASSTFFSLE